MISDASPAGALADEWNVRRQQPSVPGQRIRIGIVGVNFGEHVIKTQLQTGAGAGFFELAGVCDLNHQRASQVASSLGVTAYLSLDDLLADPTIPAIGLYIAPDGRADVLRRIIHAGKDVMTTKPLEVDPEAAASVLKEGQDLGRIIHLNSPAPVLPPDLAQIERWRQQYDLGQAVACRADTWANYREQADGSWYDDPRRCPVAPILRLGIYLINDLVSIFGDAECVQVLSSRLFTGRPTSDNAQLGIRFKSGALANVFASFCVGDGDQYCNSLVLNFENGTIYRNSGPVRGDAPDEQSELSLVVRKDGRGRLSEQTVVAASGEYRWDVFYQAVRGERISGLLPIDRSVEGLRIVRAMVKAEQAGQCVSVH